MDTRKARTIERLIQTTKLLYFHGIEKAVLKLVMGDVVQITCKKMYNISECNVWSEVKKCNTISLILSIVWSIIDNPEDQIAV